MSFRLSCHFAARSGGLTSTSAAAGWARRSVLPTMRARARRDRRRDRLVRQGRLGGRIESGRLRCSDSGPARHTRSRPGLLRAWLWLQGWSARSCYNIRFFRRRPVQLLRYWFCAGKFATTRPPPIPPRQSECSRRSSWFYFIVAMTRKKDAEYSRRVS